MSIEVHNVTKRFGEFTALDNVSLEVEDGSLLALLGPSGSGKSTLLRIIAGLEVPDTGTISIHDTDATNQPVQDRGVGFVFQHYAPFKHMTVWDNIAFPLKIRKKKKSEIKAKVEQLLELVHLSGFAKRFPSQLSGGQRQRMALARALAAEPEVLLLDEPFGALDARVREELRVWLRRLHEEMHVTTIFVTHDQEEAMEVAEKIVVMSNGTIEQVGTPREIYESPANDFVMQFVGPVTHVGGEPVRPHDFEILDHPADGAVEALVERVVYLGFEVRAELSLPDRKPFWVQLTRTEVEHLELRDGEIIYVRSRKSAQIIPLKQSGTE